MDVSSFDLNDSEANGRWFKCFDARTGEDTPDAQIKVASEDCDEYREALENYADGIVDAMMPGRKRTKGNTASRRRQVNLDAMAKHVFLDFKGLKEDGKALTNSEPNRRALLEKPRFLNMVLLFAQDASAFEEEELGNSESSPEQTSP